MRDDIIDAIQDQIFDVIITNFFENGLKRFQEFFLEFERGKLVFLQEFNWKLFKRVNSKETDFRNGIYSNMRNMLSHDIPNLRPNEFDSIYVEVSNFNKLLKTVNTETLRILQFFPIN